MRRLGKISLWIVAILVTLAVAGGIALKLFFPAEKIRQLAIEKGSEALGRVVSAQGIDISFWGGLGVRLEKVIIANPPSWGGQLLSADDVDLKLELLPLFSSEFRVDLLIVNRPQIALQKRPDGSVNYDFAATELSASSQLTERLSPETKVAAAAVSFNQLEIHNGTIAYTNDSSALTARADGISLRTSLENPRMGSFLSVGELSIDSLALNNEEGLGPFSLNVEYKAEYDFSHDILSLKEAHLVVNGVPFEMHAEVRRLQKDPTFQASLSSEQMNISDLIGLLPPSYRDPVRDFSFDGEFSLSGDIEYTASDETSLTYAATAEIADMRVTRQGLPGELKLGRAILDVKRDNLRMRIQDGSFDGRPLKGLLAVEGFDDPVISGELAGQLQLSYLQPFLPEDPEQSLSGLAGIDVKFSGKVSDIESVDFSGNMTVTNGTWSSDLLPEDVTSIEADLYIDKRVTKIRNLSLATLSAQLTCNGRISNLPAFLMADSGVLVPMEFEGGVTGELDLTLANQFLPQEGAPELSGLSKADLHIAGSTSALEEVRLQGTLVVEGGAYRDSLLAEPIRSFDAMLTVSPDSIVVNKLDVAFVSSDFSLTGRITRPFPYLLPIAAHNSKRVPKPRFRFYIHSDRFDTDRIFPEAVPGSGVNEAQARVDSVSPMILPDINGTATFTVDTLIYSQAEFTGLSGKLRVENRRIDCYDVTGMLYQGTVAGKTTIDLSDFSQPHYVGEFQASDIEADDFVSRFSRFGGHLFGKVVLKGTYDATGWEPESFLNSLSMQSRASMSDGKLLTSGALHSAMSALVSRLGGEEFPREQPLRSLVTNIIVKD
ncbi:MAG: AsmA family protein, partial [Candidatus Zixiibacteriota bacterium]